MNYLPQIRKALVAAVAGFVIAQLQQHGFSPDMSLGDFVQNSLSALASGATVWAVKNR